MYIIIGLIIMAVGVFMVIKTESILRMFGQSAFFDKYLGTEGGSRLGYKLIGILAIFIGLIVMTNMIGGFLEWLLGPLLRLSRPQQ